MLEFQLFRPTQFLPADYEATLRPALEVAQNRLQQKDSTDSIGWVTLPDTYDRTEFTRIQKTADVIRRKADALVVIGVGGSYLGARGIIECLRSPRYNEKKKDTPNLYFVGNSLSADGIAEVVDLLGDKDFCINVISKSGTTMEPAVAFRFFRDLLEKRYGHEEANRRIYATTDRHKGALRTMADIQGWETFVVPDNVGGRYSVLTAVGLLPIAVCGIDIQALMDGAASMMERCRTGGFHCPAWQYAAARHALYKSGKSIEILAAFNPSFRFMGEWWKQLFGESEGKQGKGMFPATVEFTADLHSTGQFIQDGPRIMMETVVRFGASRHDLTVSYDTNNRDGLNYLAGRSMDEIRTHAMESALLAHTEGGVPNCIIEVGNKNEFHVGELIYFFEYACGLSAQLLNVNPFDQPGVEEYKRNMFALLGRPGYEDLTETLRKALPHHENL